MIEGMASLGMRLIFEDSTTMDTRITGEVTRQASNSVELVLRDIGMQLMTDMINFNVLTVIPEIITIALIEHQSTQIRQEISPERRVGIVRKLGAVEGGNSTILDLAVMTAVATTSKEVANQSCWMEL